jgi:hypothetical protein
VADVPRWTVVRSPGLLTLYWRQVRSPDGAPELGRCRRVHSHLGLTLTHASKECTMYVPWQMQRDLVRARLNDVERAARYAPHNANRRRRAMPQIAQAARRLSAWLARIRPVGSGHGVPAPPSCAPAVAARIEAEVTSG